MWTLLFQWKCTPVPQEYKWHTPWRSTQWHCQGVLYFQKTIRCHGMHPVPVFMELALPRQFFSETPLYQMSCKSVLLRHRAMDVVCIYGDHFLLRKERPSSTRTNQKITFLFSPVQESFSKRNLSFQALLTIPAINYINTNYTLVPSALHVRWSGVFVWCVYVVCLCD